MHLKKSDISEDYAAVRINSCYSILKLILISSTMHLIPVLSLLSVAFALAVQTNPTVTRQLEARQTSPPTTTDIPIGIFTTTKHVIIDGVTNSHVTIPGKTIDIVIPTCIQTITPDENGYVPPGTCGAIWNYYPSFAAALGFSCVFGALFFLHIWQAVRYRKVRMSWSETPTGARR